MTAALVGMGIPKEQSIKYEAEIKADRILLAVHGTPDEVERARAILVEDVAGEPRNASASRRLRIGYCSNQKRDIHGMSLDLLGINFRNRLLQALRPPIFQEDDPARIKLQAKMHSSQM